MCAIHGLLFVPLPFVYPLKFSAISFSDNPICTVPAAFGGVCHGGFPWSCGCFSRSRKIYGFGYGLCDLVGGAKKQSPARTGFPWKFSMLLPTLIFCWSMCCKLHGTKLYFVTAGWYAKVFTYLILSDIGSILCASEHEFSASAVKKHQPWKSDGPTTRRGLRSERTRKRLGPDWIRTDKIFHELRSASWKTRKRRALQ